MTEPALLELAGRAWMPFSVSTRRRSPLSLPKVARERGPH
jgi:hypothetical protein